MNRTQTQLSSRLFTPSSPDYTVELSASRRSRLMVMGSAWLMLLAGLVAAVHIDVPPVLRFALALAWLLEAGRSVLAHGRAYRRFRRFSLGVEGTGLAAGRHAVSPIRLLPGSLLLHRAAWLRFESDDDFRYGELILAADISAADWRCLNVLWRHGRLCSHLTLSD